MPSRLLTTVVASAVLVGGLNAAAYTATGSSLLIGRSNSAGQTTSLTNTRGGPVLSLHAEPDSSPLAVDSTKLVKKLNADTVDGLQARSLQNRPRLFVVPEVSRQQQFAVAISGLRPGAYQVSYSIIAQTLVAGATVDCFWQSDSGSTGFGFGSAAGGAAAFATASSTTAFLVTSADSPAPSLQCFSPNPDSLLTIGPSQQASSQIMLTRLDALNVDPSTLRTSPRRSPHRAAEQ
ncbi:MAG: hypothetical protein U0R80_00460 [Nocardioidaceae bacterium]